ncbi:RHS repeat-associated core domain-containing protein [Paenibacillus urinalis]|nr:RHS repeat-associated core domain-containing protein [Paenibacillus urinalis]WDI00167.1 RHS repeat-associated core domain-containing protein [Paenibacillus urinalis]
MIERTENGITSRYYYDQYGNIIAEGSVQTDGSVKKVASYVRNGNQLNYRVDEQGEKQYYVLNGHGDVEYIVDSDGEILNSYTYDLWGKPISKNEKVSNIFLYAGEYWDPSTNLQYLRARWYNPNIGRFINEDTYEGQINSPQTLNLYAYVQNNPLIYTDPTGHASQGHVVGTLLDVAKQDGTNSERYWRIRSNLGTQALNFFPDAKEDGNNKFKYLFNMATLSGYSSGQASWAKEQLMFAFETKYQYDQAAFEQYLNGLLISLHVSIPKVPKVASAAASVTRVARNSQVGVLGELKLAELVGGKPNQYFKTTLGGRYVDQLSNGIAYESKMGFVNYSSKVMTQISKDAELLSNGSIDGATWVFFRSPSTGKIGADQRVLDALASYGIKYIFK